MSRLVSCAASCAYKNPMVRVRAGGRRPVVSVSESFFSACGAVKTKLPLAERTYNCGQCGLVIDRDHNASINLAALAARTGTASGAGTGQSDLATGRGEDKSMPSGRWSSQNRQDSAAPAGQTATAAEQSTAA